MNLAELDSRERQGTDINHHTYPTRINKETTTWPCVRRIRVIIGKLGSVERLSAPELDIMAEGADFSEAWNSFLDLVRKREDCSWLTFDLGYTRPSEIAEGLDIPEDEDWAEQADSDEE